MAYLPSVVASVGRTPLIKLNRVAADSSATIVVKGEFFNPLGSVKDRIGAAMIEAAEKDGRLTLGTTIIEPTSFPLPSSRRIRRSFRRHATANRSNPPAQDSRHRSGFRAKQP